MDGWDCWWTREFVRVVVVVVVVGWRGKAWGGVGCGGGMYFELVAGGRETSVEDGGRGG